MPSRRCDAACTTSPSSSRHSAAGTPHCAAAAATSTARACAAALRSGWYQNRTPHEPPEPIWPLRRNGSAGSAVTTLTRSSATPSSSAMITACPVCVPCPISVVGECSVTRPSGAISRYAVTNCGDPAAPAAAASCSGTDTAMASAPEPSTKSRRVSMVSPPSWSPAHRPRAVPPPRCAGRCRSGTARRSCRRGSRQPWAAASARAAPRPA